MKKGSSGNDVRMMQTALEALGYYLPRWGADGHWGDETDNALKGYADDHGIPRGEAARHVISTLVACSTPQPERLYDLRGVSKIKTGPRRAWKDITGICLHQTATCFLHAETRNEAILYRARQRAAGINTHVTVLRNGDAIWGQDFDRVVWHAQRVFNASDVGLDIDGHFAGVEGDLSTYWRPKSEPNRMPLQLLDEQVETAAEVIDFIVKTVAAHGGKIRFIHAHRQTADSRISDPGSAIWQRIAIPAMKRHDIGYGGPDFYVPLPKAAVASGVWSTDGPGRPIPKEWDPSGVHSYRERPPRPAPPKE